MDIVGHQSTSLIDYPDKICTMYFFAFCNFRCSYCHNSHIVKGQGRRIGEEEIFTFLKKRKKFIDAICLSGGEPTLHEGLYPFVQKIKREGFLVKLDTNGTNPHIIQILINENLVDFVAMDVKAPFHKYELVVNTKVDQERIKESIELIKSSGIEYEFRTTICKELLTLDDIVEIAEYLRGSKRYSLQNFKDGETVLGGIHQLHPYDAKSLEKIEKEIGGYFKVFIVRK